MPTEPLQERLTASQFDERLLITMNRSPVEILKELIRIDTTNPPGNEREALLCLKDILERKHIPVTIQESDTNRGNLVAFLPAKTARKQENLVLLSHIDVVMAKADEWDYPPFEAIEENGYIYGRGTVDTKQLTVMELMAFLALADADIPRNRDTYFIVTGDEENGSNYGLKYLLKHPFELDKKRINGETVFGNANIISEGGGFPIIVGDKQFYLCETGQKGNAVVHFTVKSKVWKGPFLPGTDGMKRAMSLVKELGSTELDSKLLPTVRQFIEKLLLAAGLPPKETIEEQMRDIQPYLSPFLYKILLAMTHNTIAVAMIRGKNLAETKITADIRLLPGYGEDYLKEVLNRIAARWDVEYEIEACTAGYEASGEGDLLYCLGKATDDILGKEGVCVELLPFISMGSSDGRNLTGCGASVLGYSPVYAWDMTFDEAVKMVHGVNERIAAASVRLGCNILTEAVKSFVR